MCAIIRKLAKRRFISQDDCKQNCKKNILHWVLVQVIKHKQDLQGSQITQFLKDERRKCCNLVASKIPANMANNDIEPSTFTENIHSRRKKEYKYFITNHHPQCYLCLQKHAAVRTHSCFEPQWARLINPFWDFGHAGWITAFLIYIFLSMNSKPMKSAKSSPCLDLS